MKKRLGIMILPLVIASCGASTTSSSSFKVRMHGIHSPPPELKDQLHRKAKFTYLRE